MYKSKELTAAEISAWASDKVRSHTHQSQIYSILTSIAQKPVDQNATRAIRLLKTGFGILSKLNFDIDFPPVPMKARKPTNAQVMRHSNVDHDYGSVTRSKKKQTKAYEKQLAPADWIGSTLEDLVLPSEGLTRFPLLLRYDRDEVVYKELPHSR